MPGPWVTTLIDTILGRDGLWYLYALFICSFVVSLVSCLHGWKWLLAGTVTIAIVWRSEMAFAVPDLFYLKDALWIYPFVVLGYLIWPAKAFMVKHRIGIAVSAGTAFAGLFWLRYPLRGTQLPPIESLAIVIHEHGLRGAFVLSMTIPYLCALAAVIALWAFYLGAEGRAIDAQAWLGRRSLGIYAIHSSVLWVMLNAGVTGVGVLIPISVAISAGITIGLERNHHSRFWLLGQSAKLPTLP